MESLILDLCCLAEGRGRLHHRSKLVENRKEKYHVREKPNFPPESYDPFSISYNTLHLTWFDTPALSSASYGYVYFISCLFNTSRLEVFNLSTLEAGQRAM